MLESLPEAPEPCPFCNLTPHTALLQKTDAFYVIADHAPLTPGHILLIPRLHVLCLAELPTEYDAEFELLKARIARFVLQTYGRLTFWENGRFGQSVPHAHLHAFAWSPDPARLAAAGTPVDGLLSLKDLYARDSAPYFFVEHAGVAMKLAPSFDHSGPLLRSGEPLLRVGGPTNRELRQFLYSDEVADTARRWRDMFGGP